MRNPRYMQMLEENRYFFLPVLNVDGANVVEEGWTAEKKILNKRKNMNPNFQSCTLENSGVDLNRNYPVDWKA